jgi:hypothetical protein
LIKILRHLLVISAIFAPTSLFAQTFNCKTPVPTLKDQMIQESIDRYLATSGHAAA